MKLISITATNYIGARNVSKRLDKPVTLFCGRNASGKSSLRDAIRHALTGEPARCALKKDFASLVTDGEKTGVAIVETDRGKAGVVLPSGKQTCNFDVPAAVPYVLDAQRFARLDANGRREFLFGLFGLSASGESVRQALIDLGCAADRIEAVIPLLRSGFEAACAEAKSRARDAKVAWRTITGEPYGSQKAQTWVATKPSFDETKLKHARAALAESDRALAENNAKLGAMNEQLRAQEGRKAKLAGLRQRASQYARFQDKLIVDQASLAEWDATVERTQAAASGVPLVQPMTCPECGCAVVAADGELEHYVAPEKVADKEAADKLPSYIQARDLMRRSVANDIAQRDDADAAAKAIAEIEDGKTPPVTDEEIAAIREHIGRIKRDRAACATDIEALTRAEIEFSTAADRTAKAADAAAYVAAWEQIADALAPDGIPGRLLQSAIGPINSRIAESVQFCEWLPIRIEADMEIMSGTRHYRMLSESEQYRADAMIAEAISHISGVKLLVLDRVDVLEPSGRGALVDWLDYLAESGEVETAILFATLKEPPLIRYDHVDVVWLENGAVLVDKTALLAA